MKGPLVVVGDALLDIDVVGTPRRLCPDAPVPVLDETREQLRPGGAALAAAMAAADGHDVILVMPHVDDEDGQRLLALLEPLLRVVPVPSGGATAVKRRIRAAGQTLARLDSGGSATAVGELSSRAYPSLREASAVLVSDYGRGATAAAGLRSLVLDRVGHAPVVWDPHPRGSAPVRGVHLVTPNAAEVATWAERHEVSVEAAGSTLARTTTLAAGLVGAWRTRAVVVTLGERGALLSYGSGAPVVVPASPTTGGDTCGAGDRFASAAATALGSGMVTEEAVRVAVHAASAYVAAGGAAALAWRPSPTAVPAGGGPGADPGAVIDAVRARGGVVAATGGCFDLLHAGHVSTLRAARSLGDCLIVCLNSDDSIRRLKGPSRPLVPAADRARVLQELTCVDAVAVFDEDTPETMLRRLRPDVWAKGGDYAGTELPEAAVLRSWGGQAVVLPYLEGRSTSSLVETAALSYDQPGSTTSSLSS